MPLPYADYEIPLLQALFRLGGSPKTSDVYPVVEAIMREELREHPEEYGKTKSGVVIWVNKVRWAREYLKQKGQLDGSERGVWKITQSGRKRVRIYQETGKDSDEVLEKRDLGAGIGKAKKKREGAEPRSSGGFLKAAEEVLTAAGEPLHYKEITRRAIGQGLLSTSGRTPERTMNSGLSTDIASGSSIFERVGRGIYTLKGKASGDLFACIEQLRRENAELRDKIQKLSTSETELDSKTKLDHDDLVLHLVELGEIEEFNSEISYPCDSFRIDVVWKSKYSAVPRRCYEVHIGGDIYKDLAALKHAYDKWNSDIFLISVRKDIPKCRELVAGSFHEIESCVKIVEAEKLWRYCRFREEFRELNGLLKSR